MQMFIDGDEIHGDVIYTTGNTSRLTGGTSNTSRTTNFSDPVPANATVRHARLYVYPDEACYTDAQGHAMALLPNETQLRVTFNGNPAPLHLDNPTSFIPEPNDPNQPADIPDATHWNKSVATYCYDVTGYYNHAGEVNNWATAYRMNCGGTAHHRYGIAGMALLVVYEDDDAPLIKYWVGEDRDLLMAKMMSGYSTGFEYADCTRQVEFTGVSNTRLANATLKTVLVSYVEYGASSLYPAADGKGDALYFNHHEMDIPLISGSGHWNKVRGGVCDIALTEGHDDARGWEYVDEYMGGDGPKIAGIQSRGSYMGVAHAILKLTYYPNLKVSFEHTNIYPNALRGETYPIHVIVENEGRSKAMNFSVRLNASAGELKEDELRINELEAGEAKDLYFQWTASRFAKKGQLITVFAEVDPENNVRELVNKQVKGEDDNLAEGHIAIGESGSGEKPTGGRGCGTGTGIGTGTEAGVAPLSLGGMPTKGGEEEGVITETRISSNVLEGYIMKKIVVPGEERAGGSAGFSTWEFLIKVLAILVGVAFVILGYVSEWRSQEGKGKGKGKNRRDKE